MKQAADRLGFRELVIKRHCFLCRQHVYGDLPLLQKIERLAWDMKAFGHPTRKDDHCCAVIQQILYICDLNSGSVAGPSLAPVPIA